MPLQGHAAFAINGCFSGFRSQRFTQDNKNITNGGRRRDRLAGELMSLVIQLFTVIPNCMRTLN